jgi:hypothetical protein
MVSSCGSYPQIYVVDPVAGSVTPVSTDLSPKAGHDQRLYASPNLPGTVIVLDWTDTTQTVSALTVTATPDGAGGNLYSAATRNAITMDVAVNPDVTLSPDGSQLALVRGWESIDRYSTTDLSLLGRRHPYGRYPTSVALRGDGWRVETYLSGGVGTAQLIRPDGSVARAWTLKKGSSLQHYFGSVAFAGKEILAFQTNGSGWSLNVLPIKLDSTLQLTGQRYVGLGKSAILKVHRTGTSKKSVTISAKPYGSAERVIGHVRLNARGNGQLKVKVTRNTTFTASVAGDADYQPASDSRLVQVPGAVKFHIAGKHPVVGGYTRFPRNGTATLVAEVPHSLVGSCASIVIQHKVSGPWRTFAATDCIELPKSRTVWAKFKASQFLGGAGYPLRMRGEWNGDAKFAGAHSGWTYARFG